MTFYRRTLLRVFVLAVCAMPVVTAVARAEDANQVTIKAFTFEPKALKVTAGTTVTWTNLDPEPHTVIDKGGKFRSAALDTKDTFTFTFNDPGTYTYFCSLHPHMVGTVEVTPKP